MQNIVRKNEVTLFSCIYQFSLFRVFGGQFRFAIAHIIIVFLINHIFYCGELWSIGQPHMVPTYLYTYKKCSRIACHAIDVKQHTQKNNLDKTAPSFFVTKNSFSAKFNSKQIKAKKNVQQVILFMYLDIDNRLQVLMLTLQMQINC